MPLGNLLSRLAVEAISDKNFLGVEVGDEILFQAKKKVAETASASTADPRDREGGSRRPPGFGQDVKLRDSLLKAAGHIGDCMRQAQGVVTTAQHQGMLEAARQLSLQLQRAPAAIKPAASPPLSLAQPVVVDSSSQATNEDGIVVQRGMTVEAVKKVDGRFQRVAPPMYPLILDKERYFSILTRTALVIERHLQQGLPQLAPQSRAQQAKSRLTKLLSIARASLTDSANMSDLQQIKSVLHACNEPTVAICTSTTPARPGLPAKDPLLGMYANDLKLLVDGVAEAVALSQCRAGRSVRADDIAKALWREHASAMDEMEAAVAETSPDVMQAQLHYEEAMRYAALCQSPAPAADAAASSVQLLSASDIKLCNVLGEGSYGKVYRAEWLGVEVAVKELKKRQLDGGSLFGSYADLASNLSSGGSASSFEKEAALMSRAVHPNVVRFFALVPDPEAPMIVMDYCEQGSLYDLLRRGRQALDRPRDAAAAQHVLSCLTWVKRLQMLQDAAAGMHYLHDQMRDPIVHGDVRSLNLLLKRGRNRFQVLIADFGLARMLGMEQHVPVSKHTNARWTAPEVMRTPHLSKQADVYSFGVVMWEVLTWRMPHEDMQSVAVLWMAANQEACELPVDQLDASQLPLQPGPTLQDFIRLMKACLEPEPTARPGFREVAAALREMALAEMQDQQGAARRSAAAIGQPGLAPAALPQETARGTTIADSAEELTITPVAPPQETARGATTADSAQELTITPAALPQETARGTTIADSAQELTIAAAALPEETARRGDVAHAGMDGQMPTADAATGHASPFAGFSPQPHGQQPSPSAADGTGGRQEPSAAGPQQTSAVSHPMVGWQPSFGVGARGLVWQLPAELQPAAGGGAPGAAGAPQAPVASLPTIGWQLPAKVQPGTGGSVPGAAGGQQVPTPHPAGGWQSPFGACPPSMVWQPPPALQSAAREQQQPTAGGPLPGTAEPQSATPAPNPAGGWQSPFAACPPGRAWQLPPAPQHAAAEQQLTAAGGGSPYEMQHAIPAPNPGGGWQSPFGTGSPGNAWQLPPAQQTAATEQQQTAAAPPVAQSHVGWQTPFSTGPAEMAWQLPVALQPSAGERQPSAAGRSSACAADAQPPLPALNPAGGWQSPFGVMAPGMAWQVPPALQPAAAKQGNPAERRHSPSPYAAVADDAPQSPSAPHPASGWQLPGTSQGQATYRVPSVPINPMLHMEPSAFAAHGVAMSWQSQNSTGYPANLQQAAPTQLILSCATVAEVMPSPAAVSKTSCSTSCEDVRMPPAVYSPFAVGAAGLAWQSPPHSATNTGLASHWPPVPGCGPTPPLDMPATAAAAARASHSFPAPGSDLQPPSATQPAAPPPLPALPSPSFPPPPQPTEQDILCDRQQAPSSQQPSAPSHSEDVSGPAGSGRLGSAGGRRQLPPKMARAILTAHGRRFARYGLSTSTAMAQSLQGSVGNGSTAQKVGAAALVGADEGFVGEEQPLASLAELFEKAPAAVLENLQRVFPRWRPVHGVGAGPYHAAVYGLLRALLQQPSSELPRRVIDAIEHSWQALTTSFPDICCEDAAIQSHTLLVCWLRRINGVGKPLHWDEIKAALSERSRLDHLAQLMWRLNAQLVGEMTRSDEDADHSTFVDLQLLTSSGVCLGVVDLTDTQPTFSKQPQGSTPLFWLVHGTGQQGLLCPACHCDVVEGVLVRPPSKTSEPSALNIS